MALQHKLKTKPNSQHTPANPKPMIMPIKPKTANTSRHLLSQVPEDLRPCDDTKHDDYDDKRYVDIIEGRIIDDEITVSEINVVVHDGI